MHYYPSAIGGNLPLLPSGLSASDVTEAYLIALLGAIETEIKKTWGIVTEGRQFDFHCYLTKPPTFANTSTEDSFGKAVGNVRKVTQARITLISEYEALIIHAFKKGVMSGEINDAVLVVDLGKDIVGYSSFQIVSFRSPDSIEHLTQLTPWVGCGSV
jgi:hypothetical protein